MALQSVLFAGDEDLEAAAAVDSAHIVPGARGPHVVKIQQALIDVAGATIKADGIYGPGTAAAVAEFKRQQQPPILNFEGKIDNIVGIKTMAALDARLPKARLSGLNFAFDAITFVDIVINFRGAGGSSPKDPEEALPRRLLQSAYGSVEDPRNRKLLRRKSDNNLLFRIAHTTSAFGLGAVPILARVLFTIRSFLAERDPELDNEMQFDKIFILGTSTGGRNALAFVRFLVQSGMKPHFVAPIDASFFQENTKDRPKSSKEPAEPTPSFKLNDIVGGFASLVASVPNRHNFFQRRGNRVKRVLNPASKDFFDLLYTSQMDGGLEEIHGNVETFDPHEVIVTGKFGPTDENFHEECDAEGRLQAQQLIAAELIRPVF